MFIVYSWNLLSLIISNIYQFLLWFVISHSIFPFRHYFYIHTFHSATFSIVQWDLNCFFRLNITGEEIQSSFCNTLHSGMLSVNNAIPYPVHVTQLGLIVPVTDNKFRVLSPCTLNCLSGVCDCSRVIPV